MHVRPVDDLDLGDILTILSLIVIGFLVSMRTEQIAARNTTYVLVARQLAQAAVDDAVAQMRLSMPALTVNSTYASAPGLAAGYPVSVLATQQLYSMPVANNGSVDLNVDQSIISLNNNYLTTTSREVYVGWIPVLNNGSVTSVSAVPMIGRYAYWVDDEAAKINLNYAVARSSCMGILPSDIDQTVTMTNSLVTSNQAATLANSVAYFAQNTNIFTPEEVQLVVNPIQSYTTSVYSQSQFSVTTYNTDNGLTPWGTKTWYLNTNALAWQAEIDSGCSNTLNAFGLTNMFGQAFLSKYTVAPGDPNLVKQITANIADFIVPRGVLPYGALSLEGGSGEGTNGIPTNYLGLQKFPYLNEIVVQPSYCEDNTQLRVQLWIQCELVNPYEEPLGLGGYITISLDKFKFEVTGTSLLIPPPPSMPYYCGTESNWVPCGCPDTGATIPAQDQTIAIPANVPAHGYSVVSVLYEATVPDEISPLIGVDKVWVRFNKVMLTSGSNPNTVCDWAILPDFNLTSSGSPGDHFYFSGNYTGDSSSPPIQGSADCNPADWVATYDNACAEGIAKNDPRVRRFTRWTPPGTGNQLPWTPVYPLTATPTTLASQNTSFGYLGGLDNSVVNFACGTGIGGLGNDPANASVTTVAKHPSFYIKASASATNYESIAELGYIHTGLQWRTLLLQPWPASESLSNYIPDWAVLDLFCITNAPRININATLSCLSSNLLTQRFTPLLAACSQGFPNLGQSNTQLVGNVQLANLPTAAYFGPDTDRPVMVSNIYNMVWANTGPLSWSAVRTAGSHHFTPGLYDMVGELCEIKLVATNFATGTTDALREARLRTFANLVTVRSDTFTVWAIGQAISDANNNGIYDAGDSIMAEAKVEAVVQRYEDPPGSVKFRTLYYRYLTP